LDAAVALLRRLAKEFEQDRPGTVVGMPDVFRGDSWQLCLQRPALPVTAAVFIRAGFKASGFDSRIGIGWGGVERLHPERISESSGPAFVRSGQALDQLRKDQSLALPHFRDDSVTSGANSALIMLEAGVGLLDALLARWTQREAAAVYGTLRKLGYRDAAPGANEAGESAYSPSHSGCASPGFVDKPHSALSGAGGGFYRESGFFMSERFMVQRDSQASFQASLLACFLGIANCQACSCAMLTLFIILIAAHVFGDFLLQTDGMAKNKARWWVLFVHATAHGALVYILLQQWG
jgi:hypothetical protein